MGLNRKGENGGSTGSSDDLLSLLQRLKDSISGISDPSHVNQEHGVVGSTEARSVSSGENKVDPIIYLGAPADVSEFDPSQDVASDSTDSRDSSEVADNFPAEIQETPSNIPDESERIESQEITVISKGMFEEPDESAVVKSANAESELSPASEEIPVEDGGITSSAEGSSVDGEGAEESSIDGLGVSSAVDGEAVTEMSWTCGAEDSQQEPPERYANPTRTIPLGGSARNRQRVLSNSNLVGAPPPPAPVGGYVVQKQRPGSIRDLIKDPVVAVLILIAVMVIVVIAASLPFILSGTSEVQRAVPLPTARVVPSMVVTSESTRLPETQEATAQVVAAESGENVLPAEQVLEKEKIAMNEAEVVPQKQGNKQEDVKGKDQGERTEPSMPQIAEKDHRWTIEIAALTKQADYERLIVQLQKDGFHPLVRVESLPSGIEVFRLEIRESEMNEALVRMAQLKRLKYVDPKNLVMKPAK